MTKIDLTDPKFRQTHIQLIGPAGATKTRFIKNMVKADIQTNNGLCLIDPEGELCLEIMRWYEKSYAPTVVKPRKPILLTPDPGDAVIDQDFPKVIDQGGALLLALSLAGKPQDPDVRRLADSVIKGLFTAAQKRRAGSRPFYLYIDDCALFLTENVLQILDQGRKYGLFLILAHQDLAQLKQAGDEVCHAVLANTKTKLVFGELSQADAQALAGSHQIAVDL